ncbi:hypothetical protein QOZ80_2BG0168260 [Eleusine coracana subsp. coracana]|nr:hypothetical protein QOZ80_2BG0168260 [Eleusine coracana subsp. coracana]
MTGGGDELKLIGMLSSPFVQRVKLALSFKGLSYEYVEENLQNKSHVLLSSNPVHKKVPVLIHNGKCICESMIIVQYLDEVFAGAGPSLLPADPYERAMARFWAAYIDDKLLSSWMTAFRGKNDEEKEEGRKLSAAMAENLEEALRNKPFFGGDNVGFVDIALGGFAAWVHAVEKIYGIKKFDAAKTPLLAAWVERFGALDAAKAVLPDVDVLVEVGKRRQAESDAAAAAAAQGN